MLIDVVFDELAVYMFEEIPGSLFKAMKTAKSGRLVQTVEFHKT